MKLKNLFYKKLSRRLNEQMLIQESLEKLTSIYLPKLKELDSDFKDETYEQMIQIFLDMDPSGKKEMFIKNILNIWTNMFVDKTEKKENAYSNFVDLRGAIATYLETVRETPPKTIGLKMKSLNDFKSYEEIKIYIESIKTQVEKIKTRKESKALKQMIIYSDEKWDVYFVEKKEQMINNFGFARWCVTQEKKGYWESYTNEKGLMIVFNDKNVKNFIKTSPPQTETEEKYVLATLKYDSERFEEINHLNNSSSTSSNEIIDLQEAIVENILKKFNVETIKEVGEKFYELSKTYHLNGNEYQENEVDNLFGETPIMDGLFNYVYEIFCDSIWKAQLLYDFIEEYGKILEVGSDIVIAPGGTHRDGFSIILLSKNNSDILVDNFINEISFIDGSSVGSLEIENNDIINILGENKVKIKIDDVKLNKCKYVSMENILIDTLTIISNGEKSSDFSTKFIDCEINEVHMDEVGIGTRGLSGTTINNLKTEYNKFVLADCGEYEINGQHDVVHIFIDGRTKITKNKVQKLILNSNVKSLNILQTYAEGFSDNVTLLISGVDSLENIKNDSDNIKIEFAKKIKEHNNDKI